MFISTSIEFVPHEVRSSFHASSFCDELHALGLDHRVEAYIGLRTGHIERGQDFLVLRRSKMALEVILGIPFLHPNNDAWVMQILIEAATDATCLDTGWLDQRAKHANDFAVWVLGFRYPYC